MSLLFFWQVAAGGTTHEASVALNGAGSLTLAAVNETRASVAFGGAGNLATAAVNENRASVAFGGAGDLTASATVAGTQLGVVAFDVAGVLSTSAVNENRASVSLDASGDFSAVATNEAHGAVAFAGLGNLSLSGYSGTLQAQLSGGWEPRRRTQEDVEEGRRRLGILPPKQEKQQAVRGQAKPESQAATEVLLAQPEEPLTQAYRAVYPQLIEAQVLETFRLEAMQRARQLEEEAIVVLLLSL